MGTIRVSTESYDNFIKNQKSTFFFSKVDFLNLTKHPFYPPAVVIIEPNDIAA